MLALLGVLFKTLRIVCAGQSNRKLVFSSFTEKLLPSVLRLRQFCLRHVARSRSQPLSDVVARQLRVLCYQLEHAVMDCVFAPAVIPEFQAGCANAPVVTQAVLAADSGVVATRGAVAAAVASTDGAEEGSEPPTKSKKQDKKGKKKKKKSDKGRGEFVVHIPPVISFHRLLFQRLAQLRHGTDVSDAAAVLAALPMLLNVRVLPVSGFVHMLGTF